MPSLCRPTNTHFMCLDFTCAHYLLSLTKTYNSQDERSRNVFVVNNNSFPRFWNESIHLILLRWLEFKILIPLLLRFPKFKCWSSEHNRFCFMCAAKGLVNTCAPDCFWSLLSKMKKITLQTRTAGKNRAWDWILRPNKCLPRKRESQIILKYSH